MFGNLFTNIYKFVAPEPIRGETTSVTAYNEVGEKVILEMQKDSLSTRMPIRMPKENERTKEQTGDTPIEMR